MVRRTPLPLLRDLSANLLVIRCQQCAELVLLPELCGDPISATVCPRRAMLERGEPVIAPTGAVLPIVAVRGPLDA